MDELIPILINTIKDEPVGGSTLLGVLVYILTRENQLKDLKKGIQKQEQKTAALRKQLDEQTQKVIGLTADLNYLKGQGDLVKQIEGKLDKALVILENRQTS